MASVLRLLVKSQSITISLLEEKVERNQHRYSEYEAALESLRQENSKLSNEILELNKDLDGLIVHRRKDVVLTLREIKAIQAAKEAGQDDYAAYLAVRPGRDGAIRYSHTQINTKIYELQRNRVKVTADFTRLKKAFVDNMAKDRAGTKLNLKKKSVQEVRKGNLKKKSVQEVRKGKFKKKSVRKAENIREKSALLKKIAEARSMKKKAGETAASTEKEMKWDVDDSVPLQSLVGAGAGEDGTGNDVSGVEHILCNHEMLIVGVRGRDGAFVKFE